jgi:hypothetical protein
MENGDFAFLPASNSYVFRAFKLDSGLFSMGWHSRCRIITEKYCDEKLLRIGKWKWYLLCDIKGSPLAHEYEQRWAWLLLSVSREYVPPASIVANNGIITYVNTRMQMKALKTSCFIGE